MGGHIPILYHMCQSGKCQCFEVYLILITTILNSVINISVNIVFLNVIS